MAPDGRLPDHERAKIHADLRDWYDGARPADLGLGLGLVVSGGLVRVWVNLVPPTTENDVDELTALGVEAERGVDPVAATIDRAQLAALARRPDVIGISPIARLQPGSGTIASPGSVDRSSPHGGSCDE